MTFDTRPEKSQYKQKDKVLIGVSVAWILPQAHKA